jgi:hypothetical protein
MYDHARFHQHHAELIAHSRACVQRSRELIARSRRRTELTVDLVSASVDITRDEAPLVRHVARQYVRQKGGVAAIAHLYRKEVESVRLGDRESATAWADIATAAEQFIPPRD